MRIYSLSFFAGTLILLIFSGLPALRSMVIYLGLLPVLSALLYFQAARRVILPSILPMIMLCLGLFWAYWQASQLIEARIPVELEGKDLWVEGVISGIPEYTGESARFVLNISKSQLGPLHVPETPASETKDTHHVNPLPYSPVKCALPGIAIFLPTYRPETTGNYTSEPNSPMAL